MDKQLMAGLAHKLTDIAEECSDMETQAQLLELVEKIVESI